MRLYSLVGIGKIFLFWWGWLCDLELSDDKVTLRNPPFFYVFIFSTREPVNKKAIIDTFGD